jgi:hypothetical protein
MSQFITIDEAELVNVQGGAGRLQPIIEGGRKLLQAGAVAWNTLFPNHPPIKPPPNPPPITRPVPQRPTISGGTGTGGRPPGGAE